MQQVDRVARCHNRSVIFQQQTSEGKTTGARLLAHIGRSEGYARMRVEAHRRATRDGRQLRRDQSGDRFVRNDHNAIKREPIGRRTERGEKTAEFDENCSVFLLIAS